MLKKIFMTYLIHKVFASVVEGNSSVILVQIGRQGLAVGPPALGCTSKVIAIVGDIRKPAIEAVYFSLRCVLLHFILPGNLRNVQLVG